MIKEWCLRSNGNDLKHSWLLSSSNLYEKLFFFLLVTKESHTIDFVCLVNSQQKSRFREYILLCFKGGEGGFYVS